MKRFYQNVSVSQTEDGYSVLLDERAVKTPARKALLLPTTAAAQIIASEFSAQKDIIDAANMFATRIVNTAIDGVADNPQAVIEDVLRYASTDLICYRADQPPALVVRQAEAWDVVLDHFANRYGLRFALVEGVMHKPQPREAIAGLGIVIERYAAPIPLSVLHTLTSLTGSLLLSFAHLDGVLNAQETWEAAHIDEDWNTEQWGEDEEAKIRRETRWTEFSSASALFHALL